MAKGKLLIGALLAAAVILTAVLFVVGSLPQPVRGDGEIKAAATIFPIYDIALNIAGTKADTVLVMRPGSSPHTFEPTPSDVKRLSGTDIIFSAGGGIDDWITGLAETAAPDAEVYPVYENIQLEIREHLHDHGRGGHHHGGHDPHYWLTVKNAKKIASNIAGLLVAADSGNQLYYTGRLKDYEEKLAEADLLIREILEPVSGKSIIVFHDAWSYFAQEYDIEIAGVFLMTPGSEPGPRHLRDLHRMVLEKNVKAVFAEPQHSPEILRPFIEDAGIELGVLDPLGGAEERDSYIAMMLYNARTLRRFLDE